MARKSITNQAIALAGIAQVCSLVQQLATSGTANNRPMEASIGSLMKIDADSVADVYGGLEGIEHGLRQLEKQLTGQSVADPEQAKYAASLIYLERQLVDRQDMLKTIKVGVEKAQGQVEHFGLLHENVLASLSDLYQNTISTISPRIMVNGEPGYLADQLIVNKIRSLLLAGIRSALLWRQCGGARWKFLLFRNKMQDEIKFLLRQL